MTRRHTQIDVPYSAAQMFDLVADVKQYPEFIPYCSGLRVVSGSVEAGELVADMLVKYRVFREKFRSRVSLNAEAGLIHVTYMNGPFRKLLNSWKFTDLDEGGSRIDFDIEFEFSNSFLQSAAQMVFDRAFVKMTDSFVARAGDVYGDKSAG